MMPCDHIAGAIVCSRGARKWRCFCGLAGGYQCDWKVGGTTAKGTQPTCDAHLCPEHAVEVAPGKHLCPTHLEAYKEWQAKREVAA